MSGAADDGAPAAARAVLEFWLDDVGESGWWRRDDAVDRAIHERFETLTADAAAGALDAWASPQTGTAPAALALMILLDQFPRNLHRGDARAFAADAKARAMADQAIACGFDLETPAPGRMFFYLPFEHSEAMDDQDRAVALFAERMPGAAIALHHAEAHRDLIRRFGRFPHRNAALGRVSTPEEIAHLAGDGYQPGRG